MTNEIRLVQHPVIAHALHTAGVKVTERLLELNIENTIATTDTVKGLKDLRTELNKELADYESQRKYLKEGILNPYNEFEAVYKTEISDKYKAAIDLLKDKIAVVENRIKEEKREAVKSYFVELCLSEDIDFVSFNQLGLDINLSTTEKAYKEKVDEFITRVSDDIRLIDTQQHKAEMLVEYRKTLNASKAIKEVQDRKEAERLEKERLHTQEVQRRSTRIRGMLMVYRDFTRTWEHINYPDIYIDNSFLENSASVDFASKVVELEERIKAEKAKEVKPEEPKQEQAKPIAAPLKAPIVETPKQASEELKVAAFEVTGTLTQLRALGEYMRNNSITYKNI
jgi:hypothetical protein